MSVMLDWAALILHVWEVPGSNLCPETSHPDRSFLMVLHSPPHANCRIVWEIMP
jgi:hypothetical protein